MHDTRTPEEWAEFRKNLAEFAILVMAPGFLPGALIRAYGGSEPWDPTSSVDIVPTVEDEAEMRNFVENLDPFITQFDEVLTRL